MKNKLHICFGAPVPELIDDNDIVLYFASDYSDFPAHINCAKVLDGVRESINIRPQTIADYLDLTSDIGLAKKNGRTFRESLSVAPEAASVWWFHMTSCRDNTSDPVFDDLIIVNTVDDVCNRHENERTLFFHGVEKRLENTFRSKWKDAQFINSGVEGNVLFNLLRGVLSRVKYVIQSSQKILAARHNKRPESELDVMLVGFWGWSVDVVESGKIDDKYYKKLPDSLLDYGVKKVGWAVWFDPHSQPGSAGRDMGKVISKSNNKENKIYFLQSYLSLLDLVREVTRVRPLITYLKYRGVIRTVLNRSGFDLFQIFKKQLLYRFLDSSIPHLRLVELAFLRACGELKPKVAVSFLETYPFSRACYSGISRYSNSVNKIAIQHGTRCEETMFFRFHPEKEFEIGEDGQSVPKSDYMYVMGNIARKIAEKSGYPETHAVVTGSPRFDHVKRLERVRDVIDREVCVLFAASGHVDQEIPAFLSVVRVVEQLQGVKLVLREHFFWKLSERADVMKHASSFEVSLLPLEDDINRADLVIYTTTTFAEECVMRSVPVWQIVNQMANFSSLVEFDEVKKIYSEAHLLDEMNKELAEGEFAGYSPEVLDEMEAGLFHNCDGMAADRVASNIKSLISC